MKKDIKYIIKRILIGVGIIFVMSFINSCQVHAEVKPIINNGSNTRYYPSGTNNISFNNWYTTNTDTSLSEIYFELQTGYTNDGYGGQIQDTLYAGQYLFDFYIETNNLTTHLASCNGSNSDFSFIDLISGNRISSSAASKSQCIDSYYTIIGGNRAIHYLYSWTITDNTSYPYMTNEYRLIVRNWTGTGYTTNNSSYLIVVGNLQEYDPIIVQNFTNVAEQQRLNQQTILNATQNSQNIINNQTQNTQDILNSQSIINQNINNIGQDTSTIIQQNNDMKNTITDSSIPTDTNTKINNITDTIKANQNSSIVQIVTFIPQTLQVILNGFNTSCTGGYSLGTLYGTELRIPCINPVNYLGSFLWGVIDSILCLCYLIPLCKFLVNKYNDLTSMKNLRWQ